MGAVDAAGPRSTKSGETRKRLLAAAREVFEEGGFLDVRITDITGRVGMSTAAFYYYFESKMQIFREVAESVEDQLIATFEAVLLDTESEATPQERIGAAGELLMIGYRDRARIMGVIEQVSRYDEQVRGARRRRSEVFALRVEESLRDLQNHGLVDPDLNPHIARAALGAMTNRFPEAWLVEGDLDCGFAHAVAQITRLLINALGFSNRCA